MGGVNSPSALPSFPFLDTAFSQATADPQSVPGACPPAGSALGELTLRIGFEVELLAPAGSSRAALAEEVARRSGGRVRRFFHTDSEPSLVPGMDHFIHLTPGFEVLDAAGESLCRLVDDITIRADLNPQLPPRAGWFRIVGDEPRLMRLVHRLTDPAAPLETVLDPLAAVFGVETDHVQGVAKVDDSSGATIAMAAPAPGERERPCEVITPPIDHDHAARLDHLLGPARDLGFTVPAEAAVHLHVDAAPLRQVPTFVNLVRLFSAWRDPLRAALSTNPRCLRLAALPDAVVALAARPAAQLPDRWDDLCAVVEPLGLKKFADVNLTRLIRPHPDRDTVEIRCLPGRIGTEQIVEQAKLVQALLIRCQDPEPLPEPVPGSRVDDLLLR